MAVPSGKKKKIFDGRYEVLAIVGRGTDSVVYHARHANSPTQEVALKVLLNQPGKGSVTERLRKEALTLVSCRHKYVVRLDDFHALGDLCYLSMEFAPEKDLRKYVAKLGAPLSPEVGERFLRQCLEAIDFVHATGVVHRDVKPDNILVINDKECRLADFGLALLPGDEPSLEDLKTGVGSFSYLPPELLEGIRYDSRSDLYALGLTFYEAMSGIHPFENLPLAMQMEGRADANLKPLHEINPKIPLGVSSVIAKLMRFDGPDRFQSAVEALRALSDPSFTNNQSTPAAPGVVEPTTPTVAEVRQPLGGPANTDSREELSVATPDTLGPSEAEAPIEPVASPRNDGDGERISNPTEKIDLERIQEIIAKDAKQRAEAAARRAARERQAAQEAQKVQAAQQGRPRAAAPPPVVTPSSKKDSKNKEDGSGATGGLLGRVPRPLRPIVVGIGAAILTVVGGSIASQLLPKGGESTTPTEDLVAPPEAPEVDTASPREEATLPTEAPQTAGQEFAFPALPAGMYAGVIDGVVPGVSSPFTLISLPKQEMLAVIVGVEGWGPVMVLTSTEGEVPPNTIIVRSNGVILNITRSDSSDKLEGTFSNAVTGDTGTWRVKKVS